MASFKDFAINDVPARTVYPTAGGGSLGARSTAYSPYTVANDGTSGQSAVMAPGVMATAGEASAAAQTQAGGLFGQPVSWWILVLLMLYGLRFIGTKLGNGEEFKNLKVTVFNIVTVSLMSILGIGLVKVAVNKFPIPGLTPFINSV